MTDEPIHSTIKQAFWADRKDDERERGIMLMRGTYFLFIPNRHILHTAEVLADHLANNNTNH